MGPPLRCGSDEQKPQGTTQPSATETARIPHASPSVPVFVKHSHLCPKCGGQRIGYQPGGKLGDQDHMVVESFFAKVIRVGRYFCKDCGFTEEWVDNVDDVQNL